MNHPAVKVNPVPLQCVYLAPPQPCVKSQRNEQFWKDVYDYSIRRYFRDEEHAEVKRRINEDIYKIRLDACTTLYNQHPEWAKWESAKPLLCVEAHDWMDKTSNQLIMDALTHRYSKVITDGILDFHLAAKLDNVAFHVTDEELESLTMELITTVREAIMYTLFGIRIEEARRHSDRPEGFVIHFPVEKYSDSWKL